MINKNRWRLPVKNNQKGIENEKTSHPTATKEDTLEAQAVKELLRMYFYFILLFYLISIRIELHVDNGNCFQASR